MALTPLSLAYFSRFKRVDGMTDEQHAEALYDAPCITSTERAIEYAEVTHGAQLKPTFVRQAVREGSLAAYRISKGYHFSPRDMDTWLESLRTRP